MDNIFGPGMNLCVLCAVIAAVCAYGYIEAAKKEEEEEKKNAAAMLWFCAFPFAIGLTVELLWRFGGEDLHARMEILRHVMRP